MSVWESPSGDLKIRVGVEGVFIRPYSSTNTRSVEPARLTHESARGLANFLHLELNMNSTPTHAGLGWAIKQMHVGARIMRKKWGALPITHYIALQIPDSDSKMTEPYIYEVREPAPGVMSFCPWVPSQQDLLAVDYFVVPGEYPTE